MGVSKTSNHIKIQIKRPPFSQELPASSKAPNEDVKDTIVLCTFKIKIKSQIFNIGISKTSDHIQTKIKIQEPPASSKPPNEDLKDMDVLCTFKIKIESQNLDHGCTRDQ